MQIMIGVDPELFLLDGAGAFVSGHDALPGTKAEPYKVNKGAVQIDGTALEFNTDPAASCEEFLANVDAVMAAMQEMVGHDKKIVAAPVAEFDPEYFKTIPPHALELGCNPDFSAYTGIENPRPDGDRMFRTGAGHIHVGWGEDFDVDDPGHFATCIMAARQLDYYIGAPSLLWDGDNRRRSLYGGAGAFRPKSYGFEYRTPSNVWLNSPETRRYMYEAAIAGINALIAGDDKGAQFGTRAKDIIDNNETDWYLKDDFGLGVDYMQFAKAA